MWSLEKACEIKNQTGCFIHVDSVQSVGKIENWRDINSQLDIYTYSAHKFGALKGIGFSLVKKNYPFRNFLFDSSPEGSLSEGTENIMGIESIQYALDELIQKQDVLKQKEIMTFFTSELRKMLKNKGEIVAYKSERAFQTVFLVLEGIKNDISCGAFDIAGIDVSKGTACTSKVSLPNETLLSMGYTEQQAKSSIRLSFSPVLRKKDAQEYLKVIQVVLSRLLK